MLQFDLKFTFDDRSPGHQRIEKGQIWFLILRTHWCRCRPYQQRQPHGRQTPSLHPVVSFLVMSAMQVGTSEGIRDTTALSPFDAPPPSLPHAWSAPHTM